MFEVYQYFWELNVVIRRYFQKFTVVHNLSIFLDTNNRNTHVTSVLIFEKMTFLGAVRPKTSGVRTKN